MHNKAWNKHRTPQWEQQSTTTTESPPYNGQQPMPPGALVQCTDTKSPP